MTCDNYVPNIKIIYGLVSYTIDSCEILKELNEKIQLIEPILNKIQERCDIRISCSLLFHEM